MDVKKYCNYCGSAIETGKTCCSHCGKLINYESVKNNVDSFKSNKSDSCFKKIYDSTYSDLYGYVYLYTHNDKISEEIIKKTYLEAYAKANKRSSTSEFEDWLKELAYKYYVQKTKDTMQNQTRCDDLIGYTGKVDNEYITIPDDALEDPELKGILIKEINKMQDMHRIIMLRYYYEGHTIEQISDETDLCESTVFTYLNRARKCIGITLKDYIKKHRVETIEVNVPPIANLYFKQLVVDYEKDKAPNEDLFKEILEEKENKKSSKVTLFGFIANKIANSYLVTG